MKKLVFATLTILALLFSLLPANTAFAKDGGSSLLSVRNRSGGDVTITLYSADGSKTLTYEVGTYFSTVGAGTYTFYAVTPCGVQSGIINLTRNKQLYFSCDKGRTIQLQVPVAPDAEPSCGVYGYLSSDASNPKYSSTPHGQYTTYGCADGKGLVDN